MDQGVGVRIAGFGAENDEWLNVKNVVRRCSLPCDAFKCVCIKPGDLICCFQESTEQEMNKSSYRPRHARLIFLRYIKE